VRVITVKDKGDIRIPVDMRRALGLDEGAKVLMEQDGDHLIIRPIRARQRPEGFLGVFKGKVAHAGAVTCDTIERAMVEETLERSSRNG
jgi:AbrB family looped-hinge helix DNA binding protein